MYAINKPTFIKRLAEAERVTIIGITHDNLSREYLPEALKKKREHAKNSRDFWVKMRVVFLAESMLGSVNDEHGKDANAAKNRRDIAADARQRLFQFLTENGASAQCELLEYEWMVPFIGAVLKDSFGQHTVQVATLWPGHSTADLPFIEIHSPHPLADYYEEAFESVIGACNPLDPMALLGVPYLDGGGV